MWIGIALLAVALIVGGIIWSAQAPGQYDAFAQCIDESGATFYGAFWCPHCQDQKAIFGKSERLLPYVECSTPDRRGQLPVCQEAGITGYPTWEFADGSRISSVLSLEQLSRETGCSLSQE